MKLLIRNNVAILLALVFGPLTSGVPIVQALCGTSQGAPMLCRMAECDDEVPTGSIITSPACCTPHVVVDGVSESYVKPLQFTQALAVALITDFGTLPHIDPPARSTGIRSTIPAVHTPPLYISHQALLI